MFINLLITDLLINRHKNICLGEESLYMDFQYVSGLGLLIINKFVIYGLMTDGSQENGHVIYTTT